MCTVCGCGGGEATRGGGRRGTATKPAAGPARAWKAVATNAHEHAHLPDDGPSAQHGPHRADAGARELQINTGKGCHLDADMVGRALVQMELADDLVWARDGIVLNPYSKNMGNLFGSEY